MNTQPSETKPVEGSMPNPSTARTVHQRMRMLANLMLALANDIPSLGELQERSGPQLSTLAGRLISDALWGLDEYEWDKTLRWLRDNASHGLAEDLNDKCDALPIHDFRYVESVARRMKMESRRTYVEGPSAKSLPTRPSEFLRLQDTFQRFGEALREAAEETAKVEVSGRPPTGGGPEMLDVAKVCDLGEYAFRQCGDTGYTARFAGGEPKIIPRRAGKLFGLDYIHVLLRHEAERHESPANTPDTMKPKDLLRAAAGAPPDQMSDERTDRLIDPTTWTQAQERRENLRREIDHPNTDPVGKAECREELERLDEVIAKSTRPGPKSKPKARTFSSKASKQADSIRNAVNRAIKKIEAQDHDLAEHLKEYIDHRGGHKYAPPHHIDWDLG